MLRSHCRQTVEVFRSHCRQTVEGFRSGFRSHRRQIASSWLVFRAILKHLTAMAQFSTAWQRWLRILPRALFAEMGPKN